MAPPSVTVSPNPHDAFDTITLSGGPFGASQGSGVVYMIDDRGTVVNMEVQTWADASITATYPVYEVYRTVTESWYVIVDASTEAGEGAGTYVGVPPIAVALEPGSPVFVPAGGIRAERQSASRGYVRVVGQSTFDVELLKDDGTFAAAVPVVDTAVIPMGTISRNYLVKQEIFPPYVPGPPPPALANSTTVVVSNQNPAVVGATVQFTATVSGGVGTPTGSVEFRVDGLLVSTQTLAGGIATYQTSGLTVGSRLIRADYLGSVTYNPSFGTETQTMNAAAQNTTTVASTTPNPSNQGSNVTISATVSAGVGTPTGDVDFFIDGTPYGSNPVALAGGVASFGTTALAVGGRVIRAEYLGTIAYNPSVSADHNHTVNAVANGTTTVVTATPNPSNIGQQVDITATVTSGGGTPTGNVLFVIGGVSYGGNPVALSGGQATIPYTFNGSGTVGITADYLGGGGFNPSSSITYNQNIRQNTTTAVNSSPDPTDMGEGFNVTATVNAASGTPTGNVNIFINGSPYGSNPVALVSGTATISQNIGSGGTTNYTADYLGSAGYNVSSSSTHGHTTRPQPGIQLSTNPPNASPPGLNVSFIANFTASSPQPTGTVDFFDQTTSTSLGTPTIVGGTCSVSTSSLSAGVHTIAAQYSGDANYSPQSDVGNYTIGAVDTETAEGFNVVPGGQYGRLVTATVSVTWVGGVVATGNVELVLDGITQGVVALNGSGQAVYNFDTTPGSHHIRTDYLGAAYYNTSFFEEDPSF